jgi:outer membrane protein
LKKNFVIATLSLGIAAMAQTPTNQPTGVTPPQSAPQAAPKQTPMPPTITGKIAVIRTQQAIMATKEGQYASAAIQAKFDPRKAEFAKREGGIQELQDQLKKGGSTMNEETKAKMQRDLDSRSKAYERDIQDANEDLDQELSKVMNDLGAKMVNVVISQYAAQNGYAAVFDVSNQNTGVLWAAPSTDITADIIKLYDQAYPPGAAAKGPAAPAGAAKPPAQQIKPPAPQIKK